MNSWIPRVWISDALARLANQQGRSATMISTTSSGGYASGGIDNNRSSVKSRTRSASSIRGSKLARVSSASGVSSKRSTSPPVGRNNTSGRVVLPAVQSANSAVGALVASAPLINHANRQRLISPNDNTNKLINSLRIRTDSVNSAAGGKCIDCGVIRCEFRHLHHVYFSSLLS